MLSLHRRASESSSVRPVDRLKIDRKKGAEIMAGMPVLVMQVLVVALLCIVASAVATLHPLSEAEKVAAKQLFVVRDDGSFGR